MAATLMAGEIEERLEPPSVAELVRELGDNARRSGLNVVAHRRLTMIGPNVYARVLVLRAQAPSASDRLMIYDERNDTLVEGFSYEPTPEVAHVHQPTYPPALNVYGEGAGPQRPNGYRISITAVGDFTGDANPDLLLTLSPQLYLKTFPSS